MPPTSRAARPPRARGEYRKSKHTRAAILDASLAVFAESGYHKGSLRQVAERVGMSEAGMLHHFPSKRALLLAVLEHRDEQSRVIVPDDVSGRAALRGMIAVARDSESKPGMVRTYTVISGEATALDHPAHDFFVQRYIYLRQRMTAAFNTIREEGGLCPDVDPHAAAVMTIAIWDGLQVQWLLDPSAVDLPAQLEQHLNSYLIDPL